MAIVLDSSSFPTSEQSEAFHAGLDSALPPHTRVDVARDSRGTLSTWPLGHDAGLIALDGFTEELRLTGRSRRQLRDSVPDKLSVALNRTDTCLTDCRGVREQGDRLRLLDLTSVYTIGYRGPCRTISLEIDYDAIDLEVDAIRDVIARVAFSPLHDLVHRHLRDVCDAADQLTDADLATTGTATAHLVRALVNSVSDHDADRREALSDTLVPRIEDYVRRHLGDPGLTPSQLADAHHVSLRYLYVVLRDHAETPAEWIMTQRLEAARRDLRDRTETVSAVAQRWGFRDHSHFTRRFKAAYGLTPSAYARARETLGSPRGPQPHARLHEPVTG